MGITIAIIVAGFNAYWLVRWKPAGVWEALNGSLSKWLSAVMWSYDMWGAANFIYWLKT